MRIQYQHGEGKEARKDLVHMLNSALVATERCICCILENYQRCNEDGSLYVEVPRVLQPYMGMKRIPFVKLPARRKTRVVDI